MTTHESGESARRVLIIGTDGMRPDLADREMMPTFTRILREGTRFVNYSAAFLPHTRVSMTTLTTGVYPGKHGVLQNAMYIPGFGTDGRLQTGDDSHLLSYKKTMDEPFILAPTLGDRLHQHGKHLAVAGSSSPGASLLWNINHPEMVINPGSTYGVPSIGEIHRTMGRVAAEQGKSKHESAWWATRALLENWLDNEQNQVMVLWLSEPDASYHTYGLASEEAIASMHTVDRCIGWILDELKKRGMEDSTNVLWISDHGHSTVRAQGTLQEHLQGAQQELGLKAEYVIADNFIYTKEQQSANIAEATRLVQWLQQQPWCDLVLSSAPALAALPGVLAFEQVIGPVKHQRLPLLSVTSAWSHEENEHGVPGTMMTLTSEAALRTQHGSLSPYDLRALCLGYGPAFEQGKIVELPCGLIDIAPTVCELIGLSAEQGFDGKSLLQTTESTWEEKIIPSGYEQRGLKIAAVGSSFYLRGSTQEIDQEQHYELEYEQDNELEDK
jgi:predicted AlkP superfamily pyrophosphatase or phosphodiesterase